MYYCHPTHAFRDDCGLMPTARSENLSLIVSPERCFSTSLGFSLQEYILMFLFMLKPL